MLGKCLNRLHGSFSRRTLFLCEEKTSLETHWLHQGETLEVGGVSFSAHQDLPFSSSSTLMVNDWLSFLECKGLTYPIIPGTSSTLT